MQALGLILDSLFDSEVNQNMLQYSEKTVSETQTQMFCCSDIHLYLPLVESQHGLIFETLKICFSLLQLSLLS